MEKSNITFVKINHVWGKLITEDPHILESVVKKFSIKVDNFWFMPAYKAGRWDGKIKFVETDGTFYVGIFKKILNYVKDDSLYKIDVDPDFYQEEDSIEFKQRFLDNISNLEYPFEPRSYQLRGALKSAYYKRGICEHVTSSGKSFTICLTIHHILQDNPDHKVIILVPKIDLVEQFVENLEEYGIPINIVGKYCGYQKDEDSQIVVSTWQSVYKKKEFLKKFNVLIVDECHGLRADEVRGVAEKAINADIRLGFTGTMPDSQADYMLIQGVLGPVIDAVDYEELQKAKQIAQIKINVVQCMFPEEILEENSQEDFIAEKNRVETNEKRNKIICKIAKEYTSRGKNSLILVQKLDHIESIKEIVEKAGMNYFVVTGETKVKDRNNARHEVEKTGGQVIIATTGVYSTGVSIKRLHCVIFASPGKSKIQTLQSVGRGLRLHDTKTHLHLYDICENLKFSKKHLTQRLKHYTKAKFMYNIKEVSM